MQCILKAVLFLVAAISIFSTSRAEESDENRKPPVSDTIVPYPWTVEAVSGRLPVLHITTERFAPILDKETKIPAKLCVTIPEECDSIYATFATDTLDLEIKGRGNSTWLQPKKPYKLKFSKKTSILGMPKHKHFALLAVYGNFSEWECKLLGVELARLAGMEWAPHAEPVELVLNGSYEGLYVMMESVKIDKNRLDIYEQPDLNEDEETIPYGWLVEIDNYDEENQVKVMEKGEQVMRVTYHSPEILSAAQRQWLTDEFQGICDILAREHAGIEEWADKIDAQSLAQYFIVREVMNDFDGFNGSTYMYRDLEQKWKFGPMWDNYICINNDIDGYNWTMTQLPVWSKWHIIPRAFGTLSFQEAFQDAWQEFYPTKLAEARDYITELMPRIVKADSITRSRWGDAYGAFSLDGFNWYLTYMEQKAAWIDSNREVVGTYDPTEPYPVGELYYTPNGLLVADPKQGLFIQVTLYSDGSHRGQPVRL